jgi:hypothetical protein
MTPHPQDPKGAAGSKKTPLHLIPPIAMTAAAHAHAQGAEKYGAFNWRRNGVNATTYIAAMLRHLNAYRDGEDMDPESGVSHLGHAIASANILLDAQHCGTLVDDRIKLDQMCGEVTSFASEPTTIEGWLRTLPDGYRELALRADKHPAWDRSERCYALSIAIERGIMWADTIGGRFFWLAVRDWARNEGELPPIPNNRPENLPLYPPVPESYAHWEYRGIGWVSEKPATYAFFNRGRYDIGWSIRKHRISDGDQNIHYIEAVRCEEEDSQKSTNPSTIHPQ